MSTDGTIVFSFYYFSPIILKGIHIKIQVNHISEYHLIEKYKL
jgi:hypothetical protein